MEVTIKYLGAIAEQVGTSEEVLNLEETGGTVEDLKAFCLKKYQLQDEATIQVAVNQLLTKSGELKAGDEIAFLPPFAGG